MLGAVLLGVWLVMLLANALNLTAIQWSGIVLEIGVVIAFIGIIYGCLLDYLALRKTQFQ